MVGCCHDNYNIILIAYHYTTKAVSIYYKKIKSNYIDEKTQCQLKVWLTLLIQHEIKSSAEFITHFKNPNVANYLSHHNYKYVVVPVDSAPNNVVFFFV
jgi:hypothetical protein